MATKEEDQPIDCPEELWLKIYRGTKSVSQRYHTERNFEAVVLEIGRWHDERSSRVASVLLPDRLARCGPSPEVRRRRTTIYLHKNFNL